MVCLQGFSNKEENRPQLLPCGHIICKTCTQEFFNLSDSFKCPKKCAKTVSRSSLEELPKNLFDMNALYGIISKYNTKAVLMTNYIGHNFGDVHKLK